MDGVRIHGGNAGTMRFFRLHVKVLQSPLRSATEQALSSHRYFFRPP
jgi:hypothetical protein